VFAILVILHGSMQGQGESRWRGISSQRKKTERRLGFGKGQKETEWHLRGNEKKDTDLQNGTEAVFCMTGMTRYVFWACILHRFFESIYHPLFLTS
jgi:hypothetical protein